MGKRYAFKGKGYTIYRTRSGSSPRRRGSLSSGFGRSISRAIARSIVNLLFKKR